MLTFSSAQNEIVASARAMEAAIDEATQNLKGPCDLLVYHATIGHDFQELLDTARAKCPGAEVVGCSACGVIGTRGASETMRSLAIMAIGGREFAVAHAETIRGGTSYDVARDVALKLQAKDPDVRLILSLASGIDIAADRVLGGIASVFGPEVLVFGGTSGDNMRAEATYQFAGNRVLERGLVLVGLSDPSLRIVTGVHHGSVAIGRPFVVTRSIENHVLELDGKPAWPTLMDRLDLPRTSGAAETIPIMALGQAVPETLVGPYANEQVIHTVFLVSEDHQSFFLPASCAEGTKLWLMQRDEGRIFDGTENMMAGLLGELAGRTPVAVFHTDCAARGRLTLDRISKDEIMQKIQGPLSPGGSVPWLGLYGFGEFTPVAGVNRFHTQTSSVYAMVRHH